MAVAYQFEGISSRAFTGVNDSTIFQQLQVPTDYRGSLWSFLHRGLGVMNYTNLGSTLTYAVTQLAGSYRLEVRWAISGAKADLLGLWLAQLRRDEQPETGKTEWRQTVAARLAELVGSAEQLQLSYEPGAARTGHMSLLAEIANATLETEAAKADADLPTELPALLPPPYQVPYELVADVIGENLAAARALYGQDHAALLALLLPLAGREVMADVLVGFTYYLYLDQPKRAYPFLRRAADQAAYLPRRVAKWVLDFVGSIEFGHLRWPGQAEYTLVQSLAVGNDYALLKLAYLYLQQASAPNRLQAHELARYGELLLSVADPEKGPAPHDADHSRAGYHIVASVYVWNLDLEGAARVQGYFLENADWCRQQRKLVESYLLLVFALNDEDFINSLVIDYPVVREDFGTVLGAWQHAEQRPEASGFSVAMINFINQMRGARRLYYD